MNPLEITAVILALAYLLLALRQNRLCWIAAFISAAIYWVIFAEIKLYMEGRLASCLCGHGDCGLDVLG